jgi:hypothetical protein
MSNDPAIDAVRAARIQISKEFGDDPTRLIAHYIEFQKRYADRLLRGPEGESGSAAQRAVATGEFERYALELAAERPIYWAEARAE